MATETLLSTGTTFVSSALADVNLSASAIIIVGTDPIFADSISFLKFAIPLLPVESVESAELRLFVFPKPELYPARLWSTGLLQISILPVSRTIQNRRMLQQLQW